MTTSEPHDQAPEPKLEETRPLTVESAAEPPVPERTTAEVADAHPPSAPPPLVLGPTVESAPVAVANGSSGARHETVFVPLAVSIGDGFKFGCGFFLALVMAMLVGFVLLALLFVLTSLFGLNLPLNR